MLDWFVYWFMLPACIAIAAAAMLTGISGTAMLTPTLILGFPLLHVPILTPSEAVGMALLTEFFGFLSGVVGYRRRRLIDYATGKKLLVASIPVIIAFSLVSQFANSLVLRTAYGAMMVGLAVYLIIAAATAVRRADLTRVPSPIDRIPRRSESQSETIIRSREGEEYRYRVCDQRAGYLFTAIGAAMEGLVSVGLGELEMPNLVKRCKIPIAVSAATSVFVIAITVLTGSVTAIIALTLHGGLSNVPWNLVIYTIPGAVAGGQVGSAYQGRLSSSRMEWFIASLFVLVGIAFLVTSLPVLFK
jgi:uncharacterized protein